MLSRLLAWLRRERASVLLLLAAAAILIPLRLSLRESPSEQTAGDFVEYEKGVVLQLLSDNTAPDERSDGGYRGEQMMTVEVKTGRYAGQTLLVYNYVGPLYGVPLKEGDSASLAISTYANGEHRATVYEYDRIPALCVLLLLFFLVTALVGGRTGLKSLLALVVTVLCLFFVLLPLLLRGAPTLPTVFLVCAYVTVVSFTILGGVHRKTVCAALGTLAGVGVALLFGLFAQAICRVDGLRLDNVEPLLQLRQAGSNIGLRGLLIAGVLISALGAVMDVAMSISSALEEIHKADPTLPFRALLRSGMNIGRDMVGTMTNTLILAFLGSSFTLILYLYSLGLAPYQLLPSAYAATELISATASSTGLILSIPFTAAISARGMKTRS